MKTATFGIGFVFFGDPVFQRAIGYLNQKYPDWTKLLGLEK